MAQPDSTFYSTAAQMIPTLLIAAAVEHRWFSNDRQPTSAEVRDGLVGYVGIAFLSLAAFIGGVAAIDALLDGAERVGQALTSLGLAAAFTLAVAPLLLRSVSTVFAPWPRFQRLFAEAVLPIAMMVATLIVLLG